MVSSSLIPRFYVHVDGHPCHDFQCCAPHCKGKGDKPGSVRHYLDTGDRKSMSNLHKHAKICWGTDVVQDAIDSKAGLGVADI